jgi:hypothetical protein
VRSYSKRSKASNALPQNRLGVILGSNPTLPVDLVARLGDSKYRATLFVPEEHAANAASFVDSRWTVVAQPERTTNDRLRAAFAELLRTPGDRTVIVTANSPDVPLPYLKRAFQRLKHRDVVIGPAFGGGWYLLGARATGPFLSDVDWESAAALELALAIIEREHLTLSLLPPWYVANDARSQQFFATLSRARGIARRGSSRRGERATPSEK